jgi:hypothetical protein
MILSVLRTLCFAESSRNSRTSICRKPIGHFTLWPIPNTPTTRSHRCVFLRLFHGDVNLVNGVGTRYCLTILRKSLDDKTPTGEKYQIKDGRLSEHFQTESVERTLPDFLADPSSRLNAADGRICDHSASRLTDMVWGIPPYHRLLKNSDTRLEEVKRWYDRHEKTGFRRFLDESMFIPHILPLGRPATDKDVKKGRALFHLNGKGKLSQLRLPAVAVFKNSKEQKDLKPLLWYQKTTVFIYQAEIDEKGIAHYGIFGTDGIKTVTEDTLMEIREVRHSARMLIAYPQPKAKSK